MLMYTSCGWFFDDIAGLEAVQVLRYAARCMDLLREAGDEPPEEAFLEVLDRAVSNDPAEGTGREVWARHVLPARVLPARVVAHIALLELLDGLGPQPVTAGFDVVVADHDLVERGSLALASGIVELVHRRTGATHRYVYAALHLGALEVVGACREAADARSEGAALAELRTAFARGTRLTQLLRVVTDRFGDEFDISAALPDAPDRLLHTAARTLADRFGVELDRLFTDHRDVFTALTAAGYPLPEELRAPAQLALARRVEAGLAAVAERTDRAALAVGPGGRVRGGRDGRRPRRGGGAGGGHRRHRGGGGPGRRQPAAGRGERGDRGRHPRAPGRSGRRPHSRPGGGLRRARGRAG